MGRPDIRAAEADERAEERVFQEARDAAIGHGQKENRDDGNGFQRESGGTGHRQEEARNLGLTGLHA
jgi:hypothetical protein